ncbi:hypothetical protein [Bradyrhizobium sp. dw_411]|uniref:hypothetical protein n=1 Tax=Bradyrhizobium sp. dw_411 TaxID=2720082 RepID=UPI001BD06DEF|nr:hypothetical protein [Bradyrhizobium sp. dw_411]
MDFRRLLNLALAVFVTVALAAAPLVTPAAAQSSMSGMTDMSMSMDMSMSTDMPCCPDSEKNKGCQDCPLVAMCVLKTVQAGPSATAAMPLRHPVRTVHLVLNDAPAVGLNRPPPDQPPRNLV